MRNEGDANIMATQPRGLGKQLINHEPQNACKAGPEICAENHTNLELDTELTITEHLLCTRTTAAKQNLSSFRQGDRS